MISYLTDMDGMLHREGSVIPGAEEFISALREEEIPFMVLTNNSMQTPRDLSAKLMRESWSRSWHAHHSRAHRHFRRRRNRPLPLTPHHHSRLRGGAGEAGPRPV